MRQFNLSSLNTWSCDQSSGGVALVQRSFLPKYCERLHYATGGLGMVKRMKTHAIEDQLKRQRQIRTKMRSKEIQYFSFGLKKNGYKDGLSRMNSILRFKEYSSAMDLCAPFSSNLC